MLDIFNGAKHSKLLILKKLFQAVRRPAIIFSVMFLTIGVAGYAHAMSSDITLSVPTTVDMTGHQKTEIHVGDPVGFSSTITNHSLGEKRFMYVVRVLDQNNQIQFQEGLSANIVPDQSFTVAESWTPQQTGSYTVQTFLLNGYMIASPLTDIIQTNVNVK